MRESKVGEVSGDKAHLLPISNVDEFIEALTILSVDKFLLEEPKRSYNALFAEGAKRVGLWCKEYPNEDMGCVYVLAELENKAMRETFYMKHLDSFEEYEKGLTNYRQLVKYWSTPLIADRVMLAFQDFCDRLAVYQASSNNLIEELLSSERGVDFDQLDFNELEDKLDNEMIPDVLQKVREDRLHAYLISTRNEVVLSEMYNFYKSEENYNRLVYVLDNPFFNGKDEGLSYAEELGLWVEGNPFDFSDIEKAMGSHMLSEDGAFIKIDNRVYVKTGEDQWQQQISNKQVLSAPISDKGLWNILLKASIVNGTGLTREVVNAQDKFVDEMRSAKRIRISKKVANKRGRGL